MKTSKLKSQLTKAKKELKLKEEKIEVIKKWGNTIHLWPTKELLKEIWGRIKNKFS
jgi:hypothetical protein